jgi:hypothetical protein
MRLYTIELTTQGLRLHDWFAERSDTYEGRPSVILVLTAARDTVADTLSWFLLTLSEHSRVQQEICSELLVQNPQLAIDPEYVADSRRRAGFAIP